MADPSSPYPEVPTAVLAEIARATIARLSSVTFAIAPDQPDLAASDEERAPYLVADQVFRATAEAAFRAGRAQAAADIRATADDEAARPARDKSSHLIEEWLREAAQIAQEGRDAA